MADDPNSQIKPPLMSVSQHDWSLHRKGPQDQQRHFDSSEMVEMARACDGLLRSAPRIDLLHGISAHDLA